MPHDQMSDQFSEASDTRELELLTEIFHRINRVIPVNQCVLTLPPEMLARDAMLELQRHGYSQAPVAMKGQVLGVFSYRSFAKKVAELTYGEITSDKTAPGDLPVEECLEQLTFARVTEEMRGLFETINRDSCVLIGLPEKLQGILTPIDLLFYLHRVASPFVMISEIELALRALIRLAVSQDELEQCALSSLSQLYGVEKVPRTLEKMTFDNYKAIITHSKNWEKFSLIFGGARARTGAKLKQLCDLRNDVFHFKREISMRDHEVLSQHRDWLLLQAKKADARSNAVEAP